MTNERGIFGFNPSNSIYVHIIHTYIAYLRNVLYKIFESVHFVYHHLFLTEKTTNQPDDITEENSVEYRSDALAIRHHFTANHSSFNLNRIKRGSRLRRVIYQVNS